MRYMLLIYGGEAAMANATEAEQQAAMAKWTEYTEDMRSSGVFARAATRCSRSPPPRRCGTTAVSRS